MKRYVRGASSGFGKPPNQPTLNGSASARNGRGAGGSSSNGAPATAAESRDVIDAGLKSLDHYKRALPRWRYVMRQKMLPLIRWETPYLAYMQNKLRTPALDSYFAITANLGTHTFFMIGLPIMFWCGFSEFGKGLVHILASGVFFTGFLKDMLSLPRPLSPPLHRITMSGSAALEYGFPSTHSANAVSVAVLAILMLRDPSNTFVPTTKLFLEGLSYFYAASIVFGRLYCGMHGFLDVIIGSIMGITISLVEFYCGPTLDDYMHASGWRAPLLAALIIIVLVRIHPEPADDCPCFDDSVAFAGVMIGLEAGSWHYGRSRFAWPIETRYAITDLGWPVVVGRLVSGIFVIFVWREVMKPTLLKTLPYLFRAIEWCGFSLPRRFFLNASDYKSIPDLLRLHTDTVIPSVSEIPAIMRNIRRVGHRGRSVSIGPQSAADAYETLAYRERRRRESIGSNGSVRSKASLRDLREEAAASAGREEERERQGRCTHITGLHIPHQQQQGTLADYESMMGQGTVVMSSPVSSPSPPGEAVDDDIEPEIYIGAQDDLGEREIFERLVKPRVRYDVEVVTKLVVYAGIAWFSVEGIPVMFEFIGLGAEHLRPTR